MTPAGKRRLITAEVVLLVVLQPAAIACAQTTSTAPSADSTPFPRRTDGGNGGGDLSDWIQPAIALAVVVALIFCLRYALRRLGRAGVLKARTGAIDVLAQRSLSAKHQLYLVRMGERLVLVGASPEGLATLCELTDPDEIARLIEQLKHSPGALAELFRRKSHSKGGPPEEGGEEPE